MKKKVMKRVIKRQREQIENLTKALAAMSTLNKKSSAVDIPVRTIPYINGTRLDPRLNKRLTPPGLADSIKEAEKENREFVDIPNSVYGDPSFYPDGMKTFSFRTVKADSKHDDVLDGTAKMYVDTKAERKDAIVKDIDETSMYPSRMKSFDIAPSKGTQDFFKKLTSAKKKEGDDTPSTIKSICPDMKSPKSGGETFIDARRRLDDDTYVYEADWKELLDTLSKADLPVIGIEWYRDLAVKCQSMSDVSALVLARAVIDKSSMVRATIWLIEAIRFLNENCSDGKCDYGNVKDEPVHEMLVTAFNTASDDIRSIMIESLEEYDESYEKSKEEN